MSIKQRLLQIISIICVLTAIVFLGIQHNTEVEITKNNNQADISKKVNKLYNELSITNKELNKSKEELLEKHKVYDGTLDTLKFTTIVNEVYTVDNKTYIKGITADEHLYSGLILLKCNDIYNIQVYNTYVFETEPVMLMKDIPEVNVISIRDASIYDIRQLNKEREITSNYLEYELLYSNMTLDEIIKHANNNYYSWTDSDIDRYNELIEQLGYTDDFEVKSKVVKIDQLKNNGSYLK